MQLGDAQRELGQVGPISMVETGKDRGNQSRIESAAVHDMNTPPAPVLWRCSGTRRNSSVKFIARQYKRIVVIE